MDQTATLTILSPKAGTKIEEYAKLMINLRDVCTAMMNKELMAAETKVTGELLGIQLVCAEGDTAKDIIDYFQKEYNKHVQHIDPIKTS